MVDERDFATLRLRDQLKNEIWRERAFHSFEEGTLDFAPTYKYKDKYVHATEATNGEGAAKVKVSDYERPQAQGDDVKAPAWCDRVLWRVADKPFSLQRPYKTPLPSSSKNNIPFSSSSSSASNSSNSSANIVAATGAGDKEKHEVGDAAYAPPTSSASQPNVCLLSYQRAELSGSDHKPVSALFDLCVRSVDLEKERQVADELLAALHEFESKMAPKVQVDAVALDLGHITRKKFSEASFSFKNTGLSPAHWNIQLDGNGKLSHTHNAHTLYDQTAASSVSSTTTNRPSWLKVEPLSGLLLPGEEVVLRVTARLDGKTAGKLYRQEAPSTRLSEILLLFVERGNHHYITAHASCNIRKKKTAKGFEERGFQVNEFSDRLATTPNAASSDKVEKGAGAATDEDEIASTGSSEFDYEFISQNEFTCLSPTPSSDGADKSNYFCGVIKLY